MRSIPGGTWALRRSSTGWGQVEHFGELALLGDRRRTATVRAAGNAPTRLLELDDAAFRTLLGLSEGFRGRTFTTGHQSGAGTYE